DSDDNIILARFSFCDRALTELAGVFIGFDGGGEGLVTASDYELHHPRIGVEGWRTFGSIERGDAAASAGADVDQAASLFECGSGEGNGASNWWRRTVCGGVRRRGGRMHGGRNGEGRLQCW